VRIVSVSAPLHGVLRLLWTDGIARDVDISGSFDGMHPLLRQLADPAVFSTVRVEEFGGVEWANGIDMCPHALRLKADEQDATGIAAAE